MLEKQVHGLEVRHREVQTGAALGRALSHETGISREQIAKCGDIARATSVEEHGDKRRPPPVDLCFQRAPARKPIVASYGELGVSELRARLSLAQLAQALLRALLEEFERRAIRQLIGHGHTPPSMNARRPRLSGWKSGYFWLSTESGELNSLRGPSAAHFRPSVTITRCPVAI